jgi:hypothetical protein
VEETTAATTTEAPTETEPLQIDVEKGGCGSVIGFSAVALLAAAFGLVLKKGKDE